MRLRTRLFAAAATALLGSVVLVGVGQPAYANSCSHPHSFQDGTGGYITGTDANVRSGPHFPPGLSCSSNGLAFFGQAAQYHCYTTGGDVYNGRSTWTWVFVPAINKSGWVNDSLLVGAGSFDLC